MEQRAKHFLGLLQAEKALLLSILEAACGTSDEISGVSTSFASILCWPRRLEGEVGPLLYPSDIIAVRSYEKASVQVGLSPVTSFPHPNESVSDVVESIKRMASTDSDASLATVIVRHKSAGAARRVARFFQAGNPSSVPVVVNGGDGHNEDPAEGLACMYAVYRDFKNVHYPGAFVIGDLMGDATTRSLAFGLTKLGVTVHALNVPGLLPPVFPPEVPITTHNIGDSLPDSVSVAFCLPIDRRAIPWEILSSLPAMEVAVLSILGRLSSLQIVVRYENGDLGRDVFDPLRGLGTLAQAATVVQLSESDRQKIRFGILAQLVATKN